MSRRVIAIVAASAALLVAAVALAILTRSGTTALKPAAEDAGSRRGMRNLETSPPPQNSPRAGSASAPDSVETAEVAGAGSGSAAAIAQGLETLATELAQHHWENAIAECGNPAVALAGAKACVATACELHMTSKARVWFAHVTSADRADVVAECAAAHVQLDRPHRPIFGIHRHPVRSPAGSGG